MMDSTQLILNEQLVTISAERHTIRRLNEDDRFLADYVNRAAKAGQFHFLFDKDPTLRRIVVKRVPAPGTASTAAAPAHYTQVWTGKTQSKDSDVAAASHLLRLRNSEKYSSRFREGQGPLGAGTTALWEELAADMRVAGFDVDGAKCANKFAQITQNFLRKDFTSLNSNDFNAEIKKLLDEPNKEESGDEEWLPKNKRGKKKSEDSEEFFKKILKRKEDLKDARFKELCILMRRRNELTEEKLRQNREIINILGRLAK